MNDSRVGTGGGYGVSWAAAHAALGPWTPAPVNAPRLLETRPGRLLGPGHNSLVGDPAGRNVIAYHAWNRAQTLRQLYLSPIVFTPTGPRVLP